jgi:hypothetical protein
MRFKLLFSGLLWIALFGISKAQGVLEADKVDAPGYLLLDKSLQFRITESVNSLYNFDFESSERGFKVLQYQYPEHPLPYFLMALSQWWKIAPDIENKRFDDAFIRQMDIVIEKADNMYDRDPSNKEAAFFLAGAYGDRKSVV